MAIDPSRIEVIDDRTAAILRAMPGGERVRRGLAMGLFARRVIESRVRDEHPQWPPSEVRREIARRFAGVR